MKKLRIIVGGYIGLYPTGGVMWDYIQYVIGLKELGHDVYYIEDTGQYSFYRNPEDPWDSSYKVVEYLKREMEKFGLEDRWAYRNLFNGECAGLSNKQVLEICSTSDVFINISASSIFREEYLKIPVKILIDSDPMFTQVQYLSEIENKSDYYVADRIKLSDYNYHFTFGENINSKNCRIPILDIKWLETRQPICLSYWSNGKLLPKKKIKFTTVMNWSTRSKLKFENEEWGQKDVEFLKYLSIPTQFKKAEFEIILSVSAGFKDKVDLNLIKGNEWEIHDPELTIGTPDEYKKFIQSSSAEFSIAKEAYVKSRSGWFSCRSACYLASGLPVVTEETGWSDFIPSGKGLFAFSNEGEAISSIKEVEENYERHCKCALEIANEYFDSKKVLSNLLSKL